MQKRLINMYAMYIFMREARGESKAWATIPNKYQKTNTYLDKNVNPVVI